MASRRPGDALDRDLAGDTLRIQGHIVRPRARLTGRVYRMARPWGSVAIAHAHLAPVDVDVRDPVGRFYRVPLSDAAPSPLRRIAAASLILTLICWAFLLAHRDHGDSP